MQELVGEDRPVTVARKPHISCPIGMSEARRHNSKKIKELLDALPRKHQLKEKDQYVYQNQCTRNNRHGTARKLSPELETSWQLVIALAPSIGCDWGLPVCRRWNEDAFSRFRGSSRFHLQSPDYCAHRTPNAPSSVLDLSAEPDAIRKRRWFHIPWRRSRINSRTRRENAAARRQPN